MSAPRIMIRGSLVPDPDYDWRIDAACRGQSAVMFPEDAASVIKAQRVCAECPVAVECLKYALENHIGHGIWGGKSERERCRLQRARRLSRSRIAI